MIAIAVEDIFAYAPELSSTPSSLVELYIDLSRSFVNETKWATKFKQGACLLTAHFLTLQKRKAGGTGAIASESVGELSVSYATPSGDEELKSTVYGTMFLQLRKTLPITPLVV